MFACTVLGDIGRRRAGREDARSNMGPLGRPRVGSSPIRADPTLMFKGLRSLALGAAAAIVIAMGTAPPAHAAEGTVHLVKRAGPEFDSLTSSSDLGVRQWI